MLGACADGAAHRARLRRANDPLVPRLCGLDEVLAAAVFNHTAKNWLVQPTKPGGGSRRLVLPGMAGSRTHARGFQPISPVTEKCDYVQVFSSRSFPDLPFDTHVVSCDAREVLALERALSFDDEFPRSSDSCTIPIQTRTFSWTRRNHAPVDCGWQSIMSAGALGPPGTADPNT
jgi:hypothetical protein